jgi:HSP20 family protein
MARTTIETWDPWADFARVQRQLGGLVASATRPVRSWAPPIDVVQDDGQVVVRVDLPGVRPDDVQVEVHDNVLRVAAHRDETRSGRGTIERRHGTFERQLVLADGIDSSAITASYEHGVLELRIPEPTKAAPRAIAVQLGHPVASPALDEPAVDEPTVEVEGGPDVTAEGPTTTEG